MLDRKKFIQTVGVATGATLLASASSLQSCARSKEKIVILHTNDVHSRIESFPADSKWPNAGGYARRAALVDELREREKNVLLLDAGDVFQGTAYYNFFKGEVEYKLMSKMNYTAGTLGNHEFDSGVDALKNALSFAQFPIVVSNYVFDDPFMRNTIKPYWVLELGAIRVGILGLGIRLDGLASKFNIEGVHYQDPVEVAQSTSLFLKEEKHCDLIIALSHLGYSYPEDRPNRTPSDIDIAKASDYIDVIIGGHTHTVLQEATLIKNRLGRDVHIGQTGYGGVYLGRIDVMV